MTVSDTFKVTLNDDVDCLKDYLGKGHSIDDVDEIGNTLLVNAIIRKSFKQVDYLLDHGADIHKSGYAETTPLYNLCLIPSHEKVYSLIHRLIKEGVDVNKANKFGITPLMIVSSKEDLHLIEYLIDHGAHKDVKDNMGLTALDRYKPYNIIKLLTV